jgi:hypothetical protein
LLDASCRGRRGEAAQSLDRVTEEVIAIEATANAKFKVKRGRGKGKEETRRRSLSTAAAILQELGWRRGVVVEGRVNGTGREGTARDQGK